MSRTRRGPRGPDGFLLFVDQRGETPGGTACVPEVFRVSLVRNRRNGHENRPEGRNNGGTGQDCGDGRTGNAGDPEREDRGGQGRRRTGRRAGWRRRVDCAGLLRRTGQRRARHQLQQRGSDGGPGAGDHGAGLQDRYRPDLSHGDDVTRRPGDFGAARSGAGLRRIQSN